MRYSKILLAIVLISMLVFGSTMSAFADSHIYVLTVDVDAGSTGMGNVTGGGEYSVGDPVTVSATPNSGHRFVKWTYMCGGKTHDMTDFNFIYTHDHDLTLKAVFEQTYDLTTGVNDANWGMVTPGGTFGFSENVNIMATPKPGYKFVNWMVVFGEGNDPVNPGFGQAFTCNLAKCGQGYFPTVNLVAHFAPNDSYNVTGVVSPLASGTISGAGPYLYGSNVTLTATPNEYFTFDKWELPEGVTPTTDLDEAVLTFVMPEQNVEAKAIFIETFTVTATVKYLNASDQPIKDPTQVKVPLGAYVLAPPAIPGYTFGVSSNATGTITQESTNFEVIHKYYVPQVITNTNTVTETVFVNVPATTAPATTEVITTEAVPLGAPGPINFDEFVEEETTEMMTDGEVVMEEEVPLAEALPQTGQLSADMFYGIGGLISGLGLWLKRRK